MHAPYEFTERDIKRFARMTVVDGITVGDLVYEQPMAMYSTAAIAPSAADTIGQNTSARLFQTPLDQSGQGFSSDLTRSETNMEKADLKMDANEVFVATHAAFSVWKRTSNALATSETVSLLPSGDALAAVISNFWWEYTLGNDRTRNYGLIGGYPQGGGAWAAPAAGSFADSTVGTQNNSYSAFRGVQNGLPSVHCMRPLSVPMLAPPNIGTKVEVKCGSAFSVAPANDGDGAGGNWLGATEYLIIRMALVGYRYTMPVS